MNNFLIDVKLLIRILPVLRVGAQRLTYHLAEQTLDETKVQVFRFQDNPSFRVAERGGGSKITGKCRLICFGSRLIRSSCCVSSSLLLLFFSWRNFLPGTFLLLFLASRGLSELCTMSVFFGVFDFMSFQAAQISRSP